MVIVLQPLYYYLYNNCITKQFCWFTINYFSTNYLLGSRVIVVVVVVAAAAAAGGGGRLSLG